MRYILSSDILVCVYDVQSRPTFTDLEKYLKENLEIIKKPIVIVGNKSESGIKEEVAFEEGLILARQFNSHFVETSALANVNILHLFESIIYALE
jgi:Predicted GTPases